MNGDSEIERIRGVYERRREKDSSKIYSFFESPSHLFIAQRREWELMIA